ncbi:MAG TPA: nucleotide exchange factor GrpE [Dissulfurispiraceae bacterium]|nr:nucleotide exchange factor GrpE [Dissulfurispiraceae bacterium]
MDKKHHKKHHQRVPAEQEAQSAVQPEVIVEQEEPKPDFAAELADANEKYLRLYADFENFRKKVAKDKEELVKYANESLVFELLTVIDNLEMALKHAREKANAETVDSLVTGVDNTLRGLSRMLGKFGLDAIDAAGQAFDPAYHHAMSQVERDDLENGMVVEEFRKGYQFKDKVLRPSLVSVSKKTE